MIINIYLYSLSELVNIKEDLIVLSNRIVVSEIWLDLDASFILNPWVLCKYCGNNSLILNDLFLHGLNVIFHWSDHLLTLLYFFLYIFDLWN